MASKGPECPICLEVFSSTVRIPLVIACGHSICAKCFPSIQRDKNDSASCPVCRKSFKTIPLPARNISLLELLENPLSKEEKEQNTTVAKCEGMTSAERNILAKSAIVKRGYNAAKNQRDTVFVEFTKLFSKLLVEDKAVAGLAQIINKNKYSKPRDVAKLIHSTFENQFLTSDQVNMLVHNVKDKELLRGEYFAACIIPRVIDIWNLKNDGCDGCHVYCILNGENNDWFIESIQQLYALLHSNVFDPYRFALNAENPYQTCCKVRDRFQVGRKN